MKPSDAHIGVIDFFAIILPGAIAAAYFDKIGGHTYAEAILPEAAIAGTGGWVVYALAAYAAGHLVFLVASQLDRTYDLLRCKVWPDSDENAYKRVNALREKALGTKDRRQPMNTLSWAKAFLQLHAKEAAIDVARYEADQKFFRSLCLVTGAIGIHGFFRDQVDVGIVLVIVSLAAYARYAERRHKGNEWAYYYVLVLSSPDSTLVARQSGDEGKKEMGPIVAVGQLEQAGHASP